MMTTLILILFICLAILLCFLVPRLAARYGRMESRTGGGTEYEAKFLDVDVGALREKLQAIGAAKAYDRTKLIRAAFTLPERSGFARVRKEPEGVTMTVKTYSDQDGKNFPEEHEVSIAEDFDTGRKFMKQILAEKAYQETYREKWTIDNCAELVIDTIPGLPSYIEIECSDEARVNEVAAKLGFDVKDAHYGPFAKTYEEVYGIPAKTVNDNMPLITFESARESLLPLVTKNREKFIETLDRQLAELAELA